MKKFLLTLVAVMGIAFAGAAQRVELTASYGGYTQMDATDMHDDWDGVNTAWGAATFGINFQVTRNLWIGPSYTFSSTTTKGGHHHSNIAYHVIMLNGRYTYYRNSIVNLYAHLGLGADISHMQPYKGDAYNRGYFAFHIAPLGAQVSLSRQFAMFGEVGFGAQGLVQVGFRLNL